MNAQDIALHNAANSVRARPLLLRVSERAEEGAVTRVMHLEGFKDIYFRVASPVPLPPLQTWDFAVIGAIFTAMRLKRPLHVDGPVSRSLLANMEEFQEAWAAWVPAQYATVPVTAAREIECDPAPADRGVFAFSGGIDATYALLRHVKGKTGRRNVDPAVAVLMRGFDIGLGDDEGFATASDRARVMLDKLHTPLATVETNWKRDLCFDWELEHAAGITACLAQFSGLAGNAILGGDEGYEFSNMPWGSNPITNALMSSSTFKIRTEGMGYSRSRRLAFIVDNSDLAPLLRVCWEAGHTGRNCGRCEKCIRSQLNFRATGASLDAFDSTASLLRIGWYPTTDAEAENYAMRDALRVAKERGVGGSWRLATRIGMVKNTLSSPWVTFMGKVKYAIRRNDRLFALAKSIRNRNE